jgi:hypothetical protein
MTSPKPAPNPLVWIDPNLLQIVGLGTKDDPYLVDGRHLRWFFGSLLGFPRSGFLLRRRRCTFHDFSVRPVAMLSGLSALWGEMGNEQMSHQALGTGSGLRFTSGLSVLKAGGFNFQTLPTGNEFLNIDNRQITLRIGPADPVPPFGPSVRDPAAYVILSIARRSSSGTVLAEGFYNAGSSYRFVDRAAVGKQIDHLVPLSDKKFIIDFGNVRWLRSGSERVLASTDIRKRNEFVARHIEATSFPAETDSWVFETLLLHSGLLEEIRITGEDAALITVTWMPSRLYSQIEGWENVDQYFLPLTDAPTIYPAWSPKPGEMVALERLLQALPKALPPWSEPTVPPPQSSPTAIETDIQIRYLGAAFASIVSAMRAFLEGELKEVKPQALVEESQSMAWIEGDGPTGAEIPYRPFDFLYDAAIDPQMARLLGLMTTDRRDLDGIWDYCISANFMTMWFWAMCAPDLFKTTSQKPKTPLEMIKWHDAEVGHIGMPSRKAPIPFDPRLFAAVPPPFDPGLFSVVSLATSIVVSQHGLPEQPPDVTATQKAWLPGKKVQCEVNVSWAVPSANLFEEPRQARIFYAARRKGPGGIVTLNRQDEDNGVYLPIVPVKDAIVNNRTKITDRSMPNYGSYVWGISGMDIWGRWSPWGEGQADVKDQIPPPAPTGVIAAIEGTSTAAHTWQDVAVTFDWTSFQASAALDLAAFEIHLRQGNVAPADSHKLSTWGKLEYAPGATTSPLRIGSSDLLAQSALPAGVTATTSKVPLALEQGGGLRITVKIGPVKVPFDSAGRARLSATVRAIDQAANASPFATRAVALRHDETPPAPVPLLPGLQLTSYPDARGRAFFTIALASPPGVRTYVMRASQAVLLDAGNESDQAFALLDDSARVTLLKQLAIAHERVFTPDHQLPYGEPATEHMVEFNGLGRGWSVVTVQHTSQTGVRGAWPTDPDCFAVIAVRRLKEIRPPVIVEACGGDRSATLVFAPDSTGAIQSIQIYRTRELSALTDIRSMKPVGALAIGGSNLSFQDPNLFPEVTYFYRAIARGEGSVRSDASEPTSVRPWSSLGPQAPQLVKVQRLTVFSGFRVLQILLWRRDYRVTVFRRATDALNWGLIKADQGPDLTIDLGTLQVAPVANGYQVTLNDPVPVPMSKYVYFVRVRDHQGRTADSAAVEEAA